MVALSYNPKAPTARWKVETGESLRALKPAGLVSNKVEGKDRHSRFSSDSINMLTLTHRNIYT